MNIEEVHGLKEERDVERWGKTEKLYMIIYGAQTHKQVVLVRYNENMQI